MKKLIPAVFCCSMLLGGSVPYASALKTPSAYVQTVSTHQLSEEITVKRTIIEHTNTTYAQENSKTATVSDEYYSGNTLIGKIAIKGTFAYNGKTSRVTSKSVSSKKTYDGWSYEQNSFTSSSGTIELTGKLNKVPHHSLSVNLELSCDKNGNIS